jgi:hypothetical protein
MVAMFTPLRWLDKFNAAVTLLYGHTQAEMTIFMATEVALIPLG